MPTFLAGRFDRFDRLSSAQQIDVMTCRMVLLTGWTLEYIQHLPLEWIGKLLSYDDGLALIRKTNS